MKTLIPLLLLLIPLRAAAQGGEGWVVPDPPPGYEDDDEFGEVPADFDRPSQLESPEPAWPAASYAVTRDGLRDPVLGTAPDYGLIWNGLGWFLGLYLSGGLIAGPLGLFGWEGEFAAFALVPFAQWAVGFGGSITAGIAGSVFSVVQLVAAIVLFAGLGHHHPIVSSGSRQAGTVGFGPGGLEIAF